jgi:hypothetical protein
MAYIGLPPKANFTSGLLDRFTSTTGTTVTLTNDISSENDIVVFVNFVKQDSTTYSVGGTGNKTLTLGGTLVSSDIVEVHYLNIVGQTVNPSANSVGSSQITADVITGQTELASGVASTDELLISDAGTLKRVDVSLVGGNNTPAFAVTRTSNQSASSANALTKYQGNVEIFDTDSAYDHSTNYRFTPQVAGKYLIYAKFYLDSTDHSAAKQVVSSIYKNGSLYSSYQLDFRNNYGGYDNSVMNQAVIDMNGSSDYIESYFQIVVNSGTGSLAVGTKSTEFGGYKLIT